MKRNGPKRTENAQPVKGTLETGNAPFAKRPLTNPPFRQTIRAGATPLMTHFKKSKTNLAQGRRNIGSNLRYLLTRRPWLSRDPYWSVLWSRCFLSGNQCRPPFQRGLLLKTKHQPLPRHRGFLGQNKVFQRTSFHNRMGRLQHSRPNLSGPKEIQPWIVKKSSVLIT